MSQRRLMGSDVGAYRRQSVSSARGLISSRNRRIPQKNVTSILSQRQSFRVIEDDVDVTPKNLTHAVYHAIEEHQLTAFDIIGLGQGSSTIQLSSWSSGSQNWNLKTNSSLMTKSSSIHMQQTQLMDDFVVGDSLTSCTLSSTVDEDRAPSQFYLPT